MNVFIDTNVFLAFFHFASDDLEELKKLSELLSNGTVRLLLPSQVVDEFRRNRANKIEDALKQFRVAKVDVRYPQFCKDYGQYKQLRAIQKDFERIHADIVKAVDADIRKERLKADVLLSSLFELAQGIPTTDALFDAAWRRVQLGNPPGKAGSLGDALNWEALLAASPSREDLHFVTDDRDYCSPLDTSSLNEFLRAESKARKSSHLWFYRSLSAFFREHYPNIKLAREAEKDRLVAQLANSGSFARTHAVVAGLLKHTDFTPDQANGIVNAALMNDQVRWICEDEDVNELLTKVVAANHHQLELAALREIQDLLDEPTEEEATMPAAANGLPF